MYGINSRTKLIKLKAAKRKGTNGTKLEMTNCTFFIGMIVYFNVGFISMEL